MLINVINVCALAEFLETAPTINIVLKFTRVSLNKAVFHSEAYKRVTARKSYTISFSDLYSDMECYDKFCITFILTTHH